MVKRAHHLLYSNKGMVEGMSNFSLDLDLCD
jgi:hypothetical protein